MLPPASAVVTNRRPKSHVVLCSLPTFYSRWARGSGADGFSAGRRPARTLAKIVPWSVDGKDGIAQNLLHNWYQLADCKAEQLLHRPIWLAHVEVVRGKFLFGVFTEDFVPWAIPDALRKGVVV
jgi:hypothetical protein